MAQNLVPLSDFTGFETNPVPVQLPSGRELWDWIIGGAPTISDTTDASKVDTSEYEAAALRDAESARKRRLIILSAAAIVGVVVWTILTKKG